MNRHFVNYNEPPAPYVAMSDPAKTPSQIAEELKKAREAAQAEDAKAYANMKAPAAPAPRDEPYRPAEFDFQYHGPKGQSGDVIPKRPEPAALPPLDPGRVMPEDVHGSEAGAAGLVPPKLIQSDAEWPDGATHRAPDQGNFYRHIRTGETYIWNGSEWQGTACRWSDEEMAGGSFQRRPVSVPT